jgi:hypothetical protein
MTKTANNPTATNTIRFSFRKPAATPKQLKSNSVVVHDFSCPRFGKDGNPAIHNCRCYFHETESQAAELVKAGTYKYLTVQRNGRLLTSRRAIVSLTESRSVSLKGRGVSEGAKLQAFEYGNQETRDRQLAQAAKFILGDNPTPRSFDIARTYASDLRQNSRLTPSVKGANHRCGSGGLEYWDSKKIRKLK